MDVSTKLYKLSMEGTWDEFVNLYAENFILAHPFNMNVFGDTPLHSAISNGAPENIIEEIVEIIKAYKEIIKAEEVTVLGRVNYQGNTPLHLAASMASLKSCICIANAAKDEELEVLRNNGGETPLFLAVVRGRTDIFLCLQYIWQLRHGKDIFPCWRNNSGATILHCAIKSEYWDLADQILVQHDVLATYADEKGTLPLHLLANAPSAFTSDFQLGFFSKIIYGIAYVDVPETINPKELVDRCSGKERKKFHLLRSLAQFVIWSVKGEVHDRGRNLDEENPNSGPQAETDNAQKNHLSWRNCYGCLKIFTSMYKLMLYCLGFGPIMKIKQKHVLATKIMKRLIQIEPKELYFDRGMNPILKIQQDMTADPDDSASTYQFWDSGDKDSSLGLNLNLATEQEIENARKKRRDKGIWETPVLIAAKNGIIEMVEGILHHSPMAIFDADSEGKNIVLLAVEHKQPEVYYHLTSYYKNRMDSLICKVDYKGNSALHLAAKSTNFNSWPVPGAASQMQWEIRWYEYIMKSMPRMFHHLRNKDDETPESIFHRTHMILVRDCRNWLRHTSSACSVVAGLIVTATFPTSTTVPGGANQLTGSPLLKDQSAFHIFAISSYVSFYSALIAVVLFLSVLTSAYNRSGLHNDLPKKLLLGLTAFYVSIFSTAISFSAGHFFILREKLKSVAFPAYIVICLVVIFFSIIEFPLYFQLAWATLKKVPQRKYKVIRGWFRS